MTDSSVAAFRISARDLAEFTYFSPDIMPTGSAVEDMQAGTRAHKRRQKASEGERERSLSHSFECMGERVTVYGRMDLFIDGEVPLIEEIKLCAVGETLTASLPAHRAQAVCYAAMVCEELEKECARFCICYVNEAGQPLKVFEEVQEREGLLREMEALLAPYVRFAVGEREHAKQRDESLKRLPFPFPSYRAGQRELAAQVYTAITRKKRLFANLPTGTGKSAAVLYPALKAMGEEKTGKILYLTNRNTARQSPLNALQRMLDNGLYARVTVLTAKEKLCPAPARCHPDNCARAAEHYVRQADALEEFRHARGLWTDERIVELAQRHTICPFELALAMCELADVAMMDLNYAFDPFAQLKRLFQRRRDMTLLIDEAHHVTDRVRESLSGEMDSRMLAQARVRVGKAAGRKHPLYLALGKTFHALRATEVAEDDRIKDGIALEELPQEVLEEVQHLWEAVLGTLGNPGLAREAVKEALELLRVCMPFLYAAAHLDEDYAVLLCGRGKERTLTLYCLMPGKEIAAITKGMRGTVFFSATLTPLPAMKQLLGGDEEDACFALPSPFPPENLTVARLRISTRYRDREQSAQQVAECIAQAASMRKGKYIAYFPSYAYLRMVQGKLEELVTPELLVQEPDMDEAARDSFLQAFITGEEPKLGLCVLGGLFSEGIDLPGEQLIGVMIVGVGLPTPDARLRAIQARYGQAFGDGFEYACRIPGMQKVAQAGGRVIRGETDTGLLVLIDDRYTEYVYERLLPPQWLPCAHSMEEARGRIGEEGTA